MSAEELEQKRIDNEERLENLEKFFRRIKEDINETMNRPLESIDRKDLEEIIEEIQWEVRCLQ